MSEFFLGEEDQTLQARQRELIAALKKAKESTGDNYNAIKPPRDLIDAWTEHGYERFDYHHAMMNHDNLSNQNEGLDQVDKEEVEKYQNILEDIEDFENQLGKSLRVEKSRIGLNIN